MYLHQTETERLLIRKLEIEDVGVWESFFENNSHLPFLGLDLSLDNESQAKDWIEFQLERYKNNRFGHKALICKKSHQFIGQAGLLTQEIDGKTEIEIGYHILPKFWGKGYATEAAKYFRDYAFTNNICDSLISIIDTRNLASQKVAQKNGMIQTGQIKYFDLDVYVYRINKPDWEVLIIAKK